jgi:hypothetical protein
LVTVNLVMLVTLFSALSLVVFLTNWIMMLTLVCVLLALLNMFTPNVNEMKGRLALTHIVFETTAVVNWLVIVVYWGFIHEIAMTHGGFNFWETIHMYLAHSLPSVCLFIVYLTTDRLVVLSSHWKGLPPLTLAYGIVNCI